MTSYCSPGFKFQHLLLNVVDNPAQRVKPAGVDEMRWRQALAAAGGPDNPDRCVAVCGMCGCVWHVWGPAWGP